MYIGKFKEECDSKVWLESGAYIPSYRNEQVEQGAYWEKNDFLER